MIFYCLTCVVITAIGIFFTLQGLWLVLPFSGLEMMVLGAALYLTSRRVHRREIITLNPERVRIEKGVQKVDQSWEFATAGTRIFSKPGERRFATQRLILGAHGNYVEVGDFLNDQEKETLAFQLKGCIIRE